MSVAVPDRVPVDYQQHSADIRQNSGTVYLSIRGILVQYELRIRVKDQSRQVVEMYTEEMHSTISYDSTRTAQPTLPKQPFDLHRSKITTCSHI